MCTWFYTGSKQLDNYISTARKSPLLSRIQQTVPREVTMSGDIRPTDAAAVVAPDRKGGVSVFPMVWGFSLEALTKPIINCRIETADKKELWKESWNTRRCVIPASWYYEWGLQQNEAGDSSIPQERKEKKTKYLIQLPGTDIIFLAGLYRFEERNGIQIPVFTVITREACEPFRSIHERMPLIINEAYVNEWIQSNPDLDSILKVAVTELVLVKQ